MRSNKKAKLRQGLLIGILFPLVLFSAWCGYEVHENSTKRAVLKDDFSHANSLVFGLFSANIWREEIKDILTTQIEEFSLSEKQDSLLRKEISGILHELIDQAKSMVRERDDSFKGKIRKWAVNIFVDWDELRQQVPQFTSTILNELKQEETKQSLKILITQKVDEYAKQIHADTIRTHLIHHYEKYGQNTKEGFNQYIKTEAKRLQRESYRYTYYLLGIIGLFLLPWFFVKKYPELQTPLFILSVALAMVVLLTGLASPMIEIDARIKKIDFMLLGEHIVFKDQMLFYRSKSILQVVGLLLETSGFDMILVGVLVLSFSVILPVSKLISTGIKLLGSGKWANNKLVYWLAYHSGKWSMADVLVVAMFMAYVSFDGILDEQLKIVDIHEEYLTSISTNLTSLEPGFILFLAYVLYALVLAQLLKWLLSRRKNEST